LQLEQDEVYDELLVNDLRVIQKKDGFKFGIDAVLLANFASKFNNMKAIDLGSGTGIIPILLAGKYMFKSVYGLEIQDKYVEMAKRSVEMNNLNDKIKIISGDIKNVRKLFGRESFDLLVSNPPYKNNGSGIINDLDSKSIARHEILCNFEDIIIAAKYLLKPNGNFAVVHRPDRLVDIFYIMRKHRIEPKYIRMVYASVKKDAKLVLIRGTNNGKCQLNFLKPLFIYDENNKYTKEVNEIYYGI